MAIGHPLHGLGFKEWKPSLRSVGEGTVSSTPHTIPIKFFPNTREQCFMWMKDNWLNFTSPEELPIEAGLQDKVFTDYKFNISLTGCPEKERKPWSRNLVCGPKKKKKICYGTLHYSKDRKEANLCFHPELNKRKRKPCPGICKGLTKRRMETLPQGSKSVDQSDKGTAL